MSFSHRVDLVLQLMDQKTGKGLVSGLCQFSLDGYSLSPTRVIDNFYVFTQIKRKIGRSLETCSLLEISHDCYQRVCLKQDFGKEVSSEGVYLEWLKPSAAYPFRRGLTLLRGKMTEEGALYYINEEPLLMDWSKIMLIKETRGLEPLLFSQSRERSLAHRTLLFEQDEKQEVVKLSSNEMGYGHSPLEEIFDPSAQVRELIEVVRDQAGNFEVALELEVDSLPLTLVLSQAGRIKTFEVELKKGGRPFITLESDTL